MRDYRGDLATLGLPPDAKWEDVRAQYKRLIGQWHPDKYAADAAGRALAEEQSKLITVAYGALEQFHREHGALPTEPANTIVHRAQTPKRPRAARPEPRDTNAGIATRKASAHALGHGGAARPRRAVLWSLTALALVYGAFHYWAVPVSEDGGQDRGTHGAGEARNATAAARVQEPRRSIAVGSTFGDVYAIQGVPTATLGDTWFYGKSQIRFSRGVVISWAEDRDHPLRIARHGDVQVRAKAIRIGSTMDDVRAIQGNPIAETSSVWDYGPSRVYFEHGRVIGWENSPMYPLRIAR